VFMSSICFLFGCFVGLLVVPALFRQSSCFFFNDTATTEIYTLSLHDALPISHHWRQVQQAQRSSAVDLNGHDGRSEEHTSELQSHLNLVCRLLLEKKKTK